MSAPEPDLSAMTGMQQLRAVVDGHVPPPGISTLMGMVDMEILGEGSVAVALVPEQRHYNPIGSVHGGVHATLLDTACGCSVHTTLAPGERYTSLDLTVKYLRGITVGTGRVRAIGTLLQRGRRTALAQARLEDAEGRLLAHATSTCLIVPPPA